MADLGEPPSIDKTNNYYISRALFDDYRRMFQAQGSKAERERIAAGLESHWAEIEKLISAGYPLTIQAILQKIIRGSADE